MISALSTLRDTALSGIAALRGPSKTHQSAYDNRNSQAGDSGAAGVPRQSSRDQFNPESCYTFCGCIPFASHEAAEVAMETLKQHQEAVLAPDVVNFEYWVDGSSLNLNVMSRDKQQLRAAMERLYGMLHIHTHGSVKHEQASATSTTPAAGSL